MYSLNPDNTIQINLDSLLHTHIYILENKQVAMSNVSTEGAVLDAHIVDELQPLEIVLGRISSPIVWADPYSIYQA